MKPENGKTFRMFLIFVGGLISFTLLSILSFQFFKEGAPRETKIVEFFTIIIILISVVYLGKEGILQNDTVAALLGSIAGYVLGN